MMFCKADFEELFPDLFHPEPVLAAHQMAKSPSAECIARWEDDGGQSLPASRHGRTASDRGSQYGCAVPVLARAGSMAATMPAAAAYAATWEMHSAYGKMTKDRHDTV